jgi:hypothetical protein
VGLSFSFEAHLIDPKPQRELATAVTIGAAAGFPARLAPDWRARRGRPRLSRAVRWNRMVHHSTVGLSFSFEADLVDPKPQRESATAVTIDAAAGFPARLGPE